MDVFINAAEAVTAQTTLDEAVFMEAAAPEKGYFVWRDPEYGRYIRSKRLRRMSRVAKTGVVCSMKALETAGVKQPDAIIIGTGLGCLTDTTQFLDNMLNEHETLLSPTAFIQSVHNTVSGQIALLLGCKNYNFTFSQQSVSFETALLDAILKLNEPDIRHVLLGGIDEINEKTYNLLSGMGCVKGASENIYYSETTGYIPGEGAGFFILSKEKSEKNLAKISDLALFEMSGNGNIYDRLNKILEGHALSVDDIDILISSYNGDVRLKEEYDKMNRFFSKSMLVNYKHLTGEFDTTSAIAMWLSVTFIQNQVVPPAFINKRKDIKQITNVLIHNFSKTHKHSFILVSAC